jgi:uncharacterized protein YigE (DUF2233 family)
MIKKLVFIVLLLTISILSFSFFIENKKSIIDDDRFITYIVNPKKQKIEFFWKDETGSNFKNAENLKKWLQKKHRKLLFATNGGMYKKDHSPQGLYIENSIKKVEIDTTNGNGNFYLKPNGVFFITSNNIQTICNTDNFNQNKEIKFATQSGPMLISNGKIHSSFNENSTNLNIRNGVGILPNNEIVFVMSKKEINFYQFAAYFKSLGCKNALYLDGFVSRTYLPEKNWKQIDGDFGVIIGVTNK